MDRSLHKAMLHCETEKVLSSVIGNAVVHSPFFTDLNNCSGSTRDEQWTDITVGSVAKCNSILKILAHFIKCGSPDFWVMSHNLYFSL